mgnify:CR=1 FL=1
MKKRNVVTLPDGTIKVTGRRMYNSIVLAVFTEEDSDTSIGMFMNPTQFEMFCEQIADLFAGYKKTNDSEKGS